MAGQMSQAISESGRAGRWVAEMGGWRASAPPRRRNGGAAWRQRATASLQAVDHHDLARGLGWLSIGLGLAEAVAPRSLARAIGIPGDGETAMILRALGLREIASGVGILAADRPRGGVWARVLGDLMDLALLGIAATDHNSRGGRVAGAAAAVAGVTALDLFCGQGLSRGGRPHQDVEAPMSERVHLKETVTINRPPAEVYAFWRDFANLSKVLAHVEHIEVTGDRRSHWRVKGPAGRTVEWDAEITEDRPDELLCWRTGEGADVDHTGLVRFAAGPGGRGTVVKVELRYDPPAGRMGHAVARLFGRDPGHEIRHDLRLVKQMLETGEIARSDASIAPGPHPGQPG